MITTILSDFSRVLLFPKDEDYSGGLNKLHQEITKKSGGPYGFFDYFKMNDELLTLYSNLKDTYPIYIFTTDVIQNNPAVKKILDPIVSHVFSAREHQLIKSDPESFLYISNQIHKKPEEILYIDDFAENVEAARKAGVKAIQFQNNKQLMEDLKRIKLLDNI